MHQPSVNSVNYNVKHAMTGDRLCQLLQGLILTKTSLPVQMDFYRTCIYSTAKSTLKVLLIIFGLTEATRLQMEGKYFLEHWGQLSADAL